ncbi:MAG: hypothetical protein HKM86_09700 [Deltaproteobacteria bacterium]|nr:hypothetical protein [Deltaproteobacteria bacterium]
MTSRLIAWGFVHVPFLANLWAQTRRTMGTPSFAFPVRPISRMRVGVITTGGVHHVDQTPFRRKDENPQGDGSYRQLDLTRPRNEFVITHDWYDRRDAERDLNLILPAERLREFAEEGVIGELHPVAVGIMGHVEGREEFRLEFETAPKIATIFREEGVDAALLVPA